jgi:ribosomal protein S18 acetylase RimI-like enzyme
LALCVNVPLPRSASRPHVYVRPAEASDARWVSTSLDDSATTTGEPPALLAEFDGVPVGVLRYQLGAAGVRVLALDVFHEGLGAADVLVCAVRNLALARGLERLWVVVTNDAIQALWFYQRLGFRITRVESGAMDRARRLDPQIPLFGQDGIAVRDQLVLEARLAG